MRKLHFVFFSVFFLLAVAGGAVFATGSTTRDAVVGTGTPESCTEAALDTALATGGVITFNCGTAPHTILLTTTKIIGGDSVDTTIDGGGLITLDGNNAVRILTIEAARTVTLQNITLTNGAATAGTAGGAVSNSGTLNVINSAFTNNFASFSGGAIQNNGTGQLNVTQSSFVGNSTDEAGGGAIESQNENAIINIANSTFSGNSAVGDGLGSAIEAFGVVNITNSTVANNTQGSALLTGDINSFIVRNSILTGNGDNCLGTFTDGGGNVVNGTACDGITPASTADPLLGALTGSPAYHPLNAGSPAIDLATTCTYLSDGTNPLFADGAAVTVDQPGNARPVGAACDAGAFEFGAQGTATPTPDGSTPTTTATPDAPTATPTVEAGVELLENTGFETLDANNKPDIAPWTVLNASGDKAKCNKEGKVFSYSGDCAFQFKGTPGENAKLRQVADLTGLTPAAGDTLDFGAWVNAGSAPDLRVKIRVKYSDATAKTKLNVDVAAGSDYVQITGTTTLDSAAVQQIRVSFDNKATSGKVRVDEVSLTWVAGTAPTAVPALLPLP